MPVIEAAGQTPRLPVRVVEPILVTDGVAPSTAKLPALPRMVPAWALTANTERINKPKLNTFIFPAVRYQYLLICFLLASSIPRSPFGYGWHSSAKSNVVKTDNSCDQLQAVATTSQTLQFQEDGGNHGRLRFERIPVVDNYPDCREQHATQV